MKYIKFIATIRCPSNFWEVRYGRTRDEPDAQLPAIIPMEEVAVRIGGPNVLVEKVTQHEWHLYRFR